MIPLLFSLLFLVIAYVLFVSNQTKNNEKRLENLETEIKKHHNQPHFVSYELFRKVYSNALDGRYKSISQINLDFSPRQMKKLHKAIEQSNIKEHSQSG